MSYYQGQHSVTFIVNTTNYNSWSTWGLIPSVKPVVPQPTPVYKYVDIPGRDGSLDLSTYLTGALSYTDRKGTFDFYIIPNADLPSNTSRNIKKSPSSIVADIAQRRTAIASALNGREVKVYLNDENIGNGIQYYYKGRVHLREIQAGQDYSHIIIEYQFRPYRYYLSNNKEYQGGL